MIEHILVATDGSQHARQAAELATDLAAKYQARLSILHVLLVGHIPPDIRELSDKIGTEEPPLAVGGHYIRAELPREVRIDIAEKILAQARAQAEAQGVREVQAEWREGPTTNGILDYARENDADMIVMGSRGLSDVRGLMVGSISHKVAQLHPGSVLTVRPAPERA